MLPGPVLNLPLKHRPRLLPACPEGSLLVIVADNIHGPAERETASGLQSKHHHFYDVRILEPTGPVPSMINCKRNFGRFRRLRLGDHGRELEHPPVYPRWNAGRKDIAARSHADESRFPGSRPQDTVCNLYLSAPASRILQPCSALRQADDRENGCARLAENPLRFGDGMSDFGLAV